jgi:hypothetical protein
MQTVAHLVQRDVPVAITWFRLALRPKPAPTIGSCGPGWSGTLQREQPAADASDAALCSAPSPFVFIRRLLKIERRWDLAACASVHVCLVTASGAEPGSVHLRRSVRLVPFAATSSSPHPAVDDAPADGPAGRLPQATVACEDVRRAPSTYSGTRGTAAPFADPWIRGQTS